ncbi:MAG: recombinase family protein [Ruminococcaceae bacterium]|nr:recombinase family protein [Oscillospiraceae bacterium]
MGELSQRAAIYCRLSKEDTDKSLESESIQNQKALLIKYAAENGWDIYKIFCDEDYSGTDRTRPAFNQMIAEAEQHRFDILLVKTQSRFTRDMELVETYLHNKFLLWGIRFVAVLDHVDTEIKGNKKARQINGLINEWYLEDLSENIRAVFGMKRKQGKYIGSFPVYGYQKDPADHNHLLVEKQSAEVVCEIFRLYLAGYGKQRIADQLNERGIPNPTRYKQQKGLNYVNGSEKDSLGLWNRTTVGRILKNRMYIGDMVQGKRRRISYKSKVSLSVPKEEWAVVPDTHEAIIDRTTFETVQRLLGERTKSSGSGTVHPLAGKVRCMDCGSTMLKLSNGTGSNSRRYLRCKLYSTDQNRCSHHMIRLDLLEAQVACLIREYIRLYYVPDRIENFLTNDRAEKQTSALNKELKNLQMEVERRSRAIHDLYLDKSSGIIDAVQFMALNREYLEEKGRLESRMNALNAELENLESSNYDRQSVLDQINQLLNFDQLPRELVAELLDTIAIGERNHSTGEQNLRIHWLF